MADSPATDPCPKCGEPAILDRVAKANKWRHAVHCSSGKHTLWGPECVTPSDAAEGWNEMVRAMPQEADQNAIDAGRIFKQCQEDLKQVGYHILDSHESDQPVGIFKIEEEDDPDWMRECQLNIQYDPEDQDAGDSHG